VAPLECLSFFCPPDLLPRVDVLEHVSTAVKRHHTRCLTSVGINFGVSLVWLFRYCRLKRCFFLPPSFSLPPDFSAFRFPSSRFFCPCFFYTFSPPPCAKFLCFFWDNPFLLLCPRPFSEPLFSPGSSSLRSSPPSSFSWTEGLVSLL